MTFLEEKRLIKRFYFISLALSVVLPLSIAYAIVGDRTGEIQYVLIAAKIWAVINALSYAVYFLIPDFESKRDKIATLFFPSMLFIGLCIVDLEMLYCLFYTLVINLTFFFYWNWKHKAQ